jgi:protein TonB
MRLGTGVIKVDYGAFELKRSYQRNMAIGILIGAMIHLAAIGAWAFVVWATTEEIPQTANVIRIKDISDLAPPPSIAKKPPSVKIEAPKIAAPKIGIPEPVPDEEVEEAVVLATQDQLADISQPSVGPGEGLGGNDVVIEIDDSEFFPSATEFVAVEEIPQAIRLLQPDYPEMARKAGIEGNVWVRVLVDKEGNVRDVIIEKESGSNAGFEEEAKKAAYEGKWTPAIQNNQPVPCWVSYKIEFTLGG